MEKISYNNFKYIMAYDIKENHTCIEIEFSVDNCDEYQTSWLGKTLDIETNKVIYWFGLIEDGSQAYEFSSFEEFTNAKVFHGKSLRDIWKNISFRSIDACNIPDRLSFYLGKK